MLISFKLVIFLSFWRIFNHSLYGVKDTIICKWSTINAKIIVAFNCDKLLFEIITYHNWIHWYEPLLHLTQHSLTLMSSPIPIATTRPIFYVGHWHLVWPLPRSTIHLTPLQPLPHPPIPIPISSPQNNNIRVCSTSTKIWQKNNLYVKMYKTISPQILHWKIT